MAKLAINDMIDEDEKTREENDGFGNYLLRTVTRMNKDKSSVVLSPLSILIAMTVCMCGARNDTLKEMLNVLYPKRINKNVTPQNVAAITKKAMDLCNHYNKTYKKSPLITIANKIWITKGTKILQSYIDATEVESIENIDTSNAAQAADYVNKWVAKNTKNKID